MERIHKIKNFKELKRMTEVVNDASIPRKTFILIGGVNEFKKVNNEEKCNLKEFWFGEVSNIDDTSIRDKLTELCNQDLGNISEEND